MLTSLLLAALVAQSFPPTSGVSPASERRFEPNAGQWDRAVHFLARTPHGMLTLGDASASLLLRARGTGAPVRVRLTWNGYAGDISGLEPLSGRSNYLVGDRSRWRSGVPGFARVRYHDVAPRIDLDFYGAVDGFEYDVIVRPGGEPSSFRMRFDGVDATRLDRDGSVVLVTGAGIVRQRPPIAYQEIDGRRLPVTVRYEMDADGFHLVAADFDRSRTLVIDPTIDFSTFLGSFGFDEAHSVATDSAGNIYVAGSTTSTFFPTVPPNTSVNSGGTDAFVAKFSPDGSNLVYATYLGGSGTDIAYAIAVNASGSAYVAGSTTSSNFPAIAAFQPTNSDRSGFLARLSPDGLGLVFSTYLGGAGTDQIEGVAVDASGAAYVAGPTRSADFPLLNAFRTIRGGSFVSKFTATGSLAYSTYFGDTGQDGTPGAEFRVNLHAIAVDGSGAAYVGGDALSSSLPATSGAYQTSPGNGGCLDPTFGQNPYPCLDGAIAKLSPSGALVYATYLHGPTETGVGAVETVTGIAVSAQGDAYVVGTTGSMTFPTTSGAVSRTCSNPCPRGVFVSRLNATGSALVFSGVLGSATQHSQTGDVIIQFTVQRGFPSTGIALDALGQVIVTGSTFATDFPTRNAQQSQSAGDKDGFVAALSPAGALIYASYLGGGGFDITYGLAATPDSGFVVVGSTFSTNFPRTNAFQASMQGAPDAFVTKLRFPQPLFSVDTPVDSARVFQPFTLGGWAVDRGSATDTGIDALHVWAYGASGTPTFIAAVTPTVFRPDIGNWLGPQFATSGYNVRIEGLTSGTYTLAVYAHSSVTNTFAPPRVLTVHIAGGGGLISIDMPATGTTTVPGANFGGWAIDRAAETGTGIAAVHVWAYPNPGSGQAPIFAGVADYGVARSDIGSIFGSQFTNSGFNLTLPPMAGGDYLFAAHPFSVVSNQFLSPATVRVTLRASQPNGSLDVPANNVTVSGSFHVGGWAIDNAAPSGTGVDAVHVYAFPAGGTGPMFLGVAQLGISRPDVGAIFGSQFTTSGYMLTAAPLPSGIYDIVSYGRSTVAGTFTIVRSARITVQ